MDNFPELLQALAKRVVKLKETAMTEEATKTSAIMPFFQLLGYDVFNPEEFMPEYTADVGIKRGEKVDYAILKDGKPNILIEAKAIQESLTKHDSQLFRYFGTSEAKFAILTNGIIYRFYTDLEQQNKMDTAPFFELNITDLREVQVHELSKFRKENFDVSNILNTAAELKYSNEIKQYLNREWDSPSEQFIGLVLNNIYEGKKTKQVYEKFEGLIKASMKQFINELVNDKLKAALANTGETVKSEKSKEISKEENEDESNIITTQDEIEAYVTIRFLLKDNIDFSRIGYRDNQSYFNVLLDNNIRKWICRLWVNGNNKSIQLNDDNKTTYSIESTLDIERYKDELIAVLNKFK